MSAPNKVLTRAQANATALMQSLVEQCQRAGIPFVIINPWLGNIAAAGVTTQDEAIKTLAVGNQLLSHAVAEMIVGNNPKSDHGRSMKEYDNEHGDEDQKQEGPVPEGQPLDSSKCEPGRIIVPS